MNKTKTLDEIIEEREFLDLKSRKLDYKRKLIELQEAKRTAKEPNGRLIMDKVSLLKDMITLRIYDADNTVFASEPAWKQAFSEQDIESFKLKIKTLLQKL